MAAAGAAGGGGGGARAARGAPQGNRQKTGAPPAPPSAGMSGDPDPYTAAMNALQYFHISEVVISTLPSNRSAWVEKGLVEKLQQNSGKPVEHVEAREEAAA